MVKWRTEKWKEVKRQHLSGERILDCNRNGLDFKATRRYILKLWEEQKPKNPRKGTFCSAFQLFSREQKAKGIEVKIED